jgi:very-short-patch-repair endonuclease
MPSAKEFARKLRREDTRAERDLWKRLRNRKLLGFKFRRQEIIGPYFVDFACRAARLVIEVDGPHHRTIGPADRKRQAIIETQGWRVIRFAEEDVRLEIAFVLETIAAVLAASGAAPAYPGAPSP